MGGTRQIEKRRIGSFIAALGVAFVVGTGAIAPRDARSDTISSAAWEATHAAAYPNGIVYFLIGNLEPETAEKEFDRFFSVSRWLSNKGYQPIVISNARLVDIREAVTNPRTTGIIYSSHANSAGQVRDVDQVLLPPEIFKESAGERFKFFVISACHGDQCVNHYQFREGVNKTFWRGTTNTNDLYTFLNGKEFDERLFKNTVGGVRAKQCAFQFLPPEPPG